MFLNQVICQLMNTCWTFKFHKCYQLYQKSIFIKLFGNKHEQIYSLRLFQFDIHSDASFVSYTFPWILWFISFIHPVPFLSHRLFIGRIILCYSCSVGLSLSCMVVLIWWIWLLLNLMSSCCIMWIVYIIILSQL